MKNKVVIFTKNNARVLTNPKNLDHYVGHPAALINPDLSLVAGEPPHFWKLDNGKIVPMTRPEKLERLEHHRQHGVDNDIGFVRPRFRAKVKVILKVLALPLISGAAGALITWVLLHG
jgi:hypothetical protein